MFVASSSLISALVASFVEVAPMCAMWTDDDVKALHAMGAKYGDAFPINLVKIMAHESGCSPSARNPGGAVGLIQFEPDTLRGLGWTRGGDAFAALSVSEQLPFVDRYLAPHANEIRSGGLGVLYTVVFLPALASRASDATFVLCASHGPLAWAYAANRGFDGDRKGWITPADLARVAEEFYARTPAAQDIAARVASLDTLPDTLPEIVDVTDGGEDRPVFVSPPLEEGGGSDAA